MNNVPKEIENNKLLLTAINSGNVDLIDYLYSINNYTLEITDSCIHMANNCNIFKYMYDKSSQSTTKIDDALLAAVNNNDVKLIEYLCSNIVNVEIDDYNAIRMSLSKNTRKYHICYVKELIKKYIQQMCFFTLR